MARGRTRVKEIPGETAVMVRHYRALGLYNVHGYFEWCREHGFEPSLEKSMREREAELERPKEILREVERQSRLQKNPRRFLEMACRGEIDVEKVTRPGWREMAQAIGRCREDRREGLLEFLKQIDDVSDLVFASTASRAGSVLYVEGLIRLHDRRKQWLRPVANWKPKSHNTARQFGSLVRHLLARYEVPTFMDSAWLRADKGGYRFRDWFAHLGAGKNIRTAKTLYPMTRMMAHHFTAAPDAYSIEGALMLADIRAMNGSERVARALISTRLGTRVERDEMKRAFWLSVYRFFIDNPMLDLRHAGPIVDFLSFQKFETQEVLTGPGRVERRPPPQPNLSMTRRTPDTLLRHVEAWHGELRAIKKSDGRFWRASKWQSVNVETGPRDARMLWRFRELLSAADLTEEGRLLRHCVSTYASSCMRGTYSVWSVERHTPEGDVNRMLTVAVDAGGAVEEVRGFANRMPTEQEKSVLAIWMDKVGLKPGRYMYGW